MRAVDTDEASDVNCPALARALAFKFHRRLGSSDANQPELQHLKMQVTLSASALARGSLVAVTSVGRLLN